MTTALGREPVRTGLRNESDDDARPLKLLGAAVVVALVVLAVAPASAGAYTSQSLQVMLYSDGSAFVTQVLSVPQQATSVQVALLSPLLSNVVATDQNGAPLSYEISGANVTVYTLGSTGVTLRYATQYLTSKVGAVWTLKFSTPYNSTVVLPASSTVTYESGTPASTTTDDGEPVLALSPGSWVISYGLPVSLVTTTTGTSTTAKGEGLPAGSGLQALLFVAAAGSAAIVLAVAALYVRRKRAVRPGEGLRPDDVNVLKFIEERGGKVLEPEIRMKFALPKTSAWRQIKRLERMGYLRVTKVGSQNQIELLKKGEPGA